MTTSLTLTMLLRSPLCIARRPTAPGQTTTTLTYITGTVLRGALAAVWLHGRRSAEITGAERERFQRIFQSNEVTFGNAVPFTNAAPTIVAPQTLWREKNTSGWLVTGGSGVSDMLTTFLQDAPETDGCERIDDLFLAVDGASRYQGHSVARRLIMRSELHNQRATTQAGQLYTLEAIEAGQYFQGCVTGPDDLITDLRMTARLADEPLLGMGRGRSRGLGEVLCTLEPPTASVPHDANALSDAIESFTRMVRGDHENLMLDTMALGDDLLLPITLLSDVILRDQYLLPSSDAQPITTLRRYRPLPPQLTTMQLVRSGVVQSTQWIGGWDEVRRLPRQPQLAIALGSVWTFRIPRAALVPAINWWLAVEQSGIGERCSEGFGRVQLCHPLHIHGGRL